MVVGLADVGTEEGRMAYISLHIVVEGTEQGVTQLDVVISQVALLYEVHHGEEEQGLVGRGLSFAMGGVEV